VELGAHRILSRSADAALAAERWEALVDELPAKALLASTETVHVLGTQVVAAYAQEGRFPDAIRAAVRMHDDTSVWRRMHVQSMVAMSQAFFGDVPSARRTLDRMEHELEGLDVRSRYGATGRSIAAALVAVEDGDGARAHSLLDELDERLSAVDHWAYALAARGRALQLTHPADEAADILRELTTEHRGRRASEYALDLLRSVSGDLLVASGQTERARKLLQDAPETGPSALADSRALLRHDVPAARRRAAVTLAQHETSPRLIAEALLTMVIAATRLGLADEARRMMSRLASSLKRRGNISILRYAPRSELLPLVPPEHSEMITLVQALPEDHDAGIGRPIALTAAELRVLGALLDEPGARALAERLYLSHNTVKTHLRNAYRKLGATDRASAIAIATRQGLLD
jgi:LuxR family maltose regulon positive regulatory protein